MGLGGTLSPSPASLRQHLKQHQKHFPFRELLLQPRSQIPWLEWSFYTWWGLKSDLFSRRRIQALHFQTQSVPWTTTFALLLRVNSVTAVLGLEFSTTFSTNNQESFGKCVPFDTRQIRFSYSLLIWNLTPILYGIQILIWFSQREDSGICMTHHPLHAHASWIKLSC